ncbi:MAG: sialidase family protein [Bryobacteraceae bacterium]
MAEMQPSRLLFFVFAAAALAEKPFLTGELIFPQEKWHNHGSSIVELPNGDLLTVWYHGSGERTADDVIVEASRLPSGGKTWSPRETIADTPGFPDCNAAALVDSRGQFWLVWPVIVANEWHTAISKLLITAPGDWRGPGVPRRWALSEPLLFIPRNFETKSLEGIERLRKEAGDNERARKQLDELTTHAKDKYFARMGWMPRAHPVELPSGRIIIPLYSDGYSYSLMAITDDFGKTWTTSEPLVSFGGIQPSIARRRDGSLVTYMRDNGPAPKRLMIAESKDHGVTWSAPRDSDLPNPGAGAEVITLRDGNWALIYNDTEKGRHSLAVAISDDEGATWKWKRHLENTEGGSYHYPSLIQAKDGTLHASYSYFDKAGKSIKHAHFNLDWVKQAR